jgi:hypothetical protein
MAKTRAKKPPKWPAFTDEQTKLIAKAISTAIKIAMARHIVDHHKPKPKKRRWFGFRNTIVDCQINPPPSGADTESA